MPCTRSVMTSPRIPMRTVQYCRTTITATPTSSAPVVLSWLSVM